MRQSNSSGMLRDLSAHVLGSHSANPRGGAPYGEPWRPTPHGRGSTGPRYRRGAKPMLDTHKWADTFNGSEKAINPRGWPYPTLVSQPRPSSPHKHVHVRAGRERSGGGSCRCAQMIGVSSGSDLGAPSAAGAGLFQRASGGSPRRCCSFVPACALPRAGASERSCLTCSGWESALMEPSTMAEHVCHDWRRNMSGGLPYGFPRSVLFRPQLRLVTSGHPQETDRQNSRHTSVRTAVRRLQCVDSWRTGKPGSPRTRATSGSTRRRSEEKA